MNTELFSLSASLTLDTSAFTLDAENAIQKGRDIGSTIDSINTNNIDNEIAALDREIESLDNEIHSLEMADLDADINESNKKISELELDLDKTSKKAELQKKVFSALAEIGKEMVKEAITGMIEFAGESLSYVENSGNAIGNQLKETKEDFSLTTDALKMKIGSALAPVAIAFYDLAEAMSGVTSYNKVDVMMSQLNSYSFANLQSVESSLEGIFGLFDKYEPQNVELPRFDDMSAGLESQVEYWKEYDRVLKELQGRGVDKSIIAQYADGSQMSLSYLQAMETATDEEIATMNETYAALETARSSAANTINAAQLEADASVTQMIDTIAQLATQVDTESPGENVFEAAHGMVESLADQYPHVAAYVDKINAKINSLGSSVHFSDDGTEKGGSVGKFATGLDYVPYDNFPSLLHEGEAVLTKAEATEWRRGSSAVGATIDYSQLADAIASAMAGFAVQMDGQAVGHLVASTVSKDIAQKSKSRRYT